MRMGVPLILSRHPRSIYPRGLNCRLKFGLVLDYNWRGFMAWGIRFGVFGCVFIGIYSNLWIICVEITNPSEL